MLMRDTLLFSIMTVHETNFAMMGPCMKTLVNVILRMFKIGDLESKSKDCQLRTIKNFYSLQNEQIPDRTDINKKTKRKRHKTPPITQV